MGAEGESERTDPLRLPNARSEHPPTDQTALERQRCRGTTRRPARPTQRNGPRQDTRQRSMKGKVRPRAAVEDGELSPSGELSTADGFEGHRLGRGPAHLTAKL